MRRRRGPWIILAASLLWPGTALAVDQGGQFSARGLGAATCETYLDDKAGDTERYRHFRSWLNGYLSAYSQLTPGTFDIAPNLQIQGLADAVEEICMGKPEWPFWVAAFTLTKSLHAQRQTDRPQVLTLSAGGRSVEIERAMLRRVQEALKAAGFDVGFVDGLYGRKTRQALEDYQRAAELPVTGLPDAATVAKLLP